MGLGKVWYCLVALPGRFLRAAVTESMQASQWRGTAKVVWKGGIEELDVVDIFGSNGRAL